MLLVLLIALVLATTCPCTASSNKVIQFIDKRLSDLLDGNACSKAGQQFGRCSIGSSCIQVTCPANLSSEAVTITVTVQRCHNPVTIISNLKSSDSKLDWSHKFTKSDSVPIPGFHYQQASVIVGAFLNFTFEVNGSQLSLKISFQYGTNTSVLKTEKVIHHRIPLSRTACWFLVWWRGKSETVRMTIFVAIVIFIVLLLSGCCCCCLCRSCKRKKRRRTLKDTKANKVRARYIHLTSLQKGYRNPGFQGRSQKSSVKFAEPI